MLLSSRLILGSVERTLLVPVSLRFHCYKIPNTLFGILTIWNTCYLEWLLFGILLYSIGFTIIQWFHSLPIYYKINTVLRKQSTLIQLPKTFNRIRGDWRFLMAL